ncbi:MAG: sigma-54-dependent Fis family transcriptional regulator [Desulfarculaceae bacterium]|nr:sigma-54-dependent Fis family transcriptional regulator [Desulfarculaceae bacterium]
MKDRILTSRIDLNHFLNHIAVPYIVLDTDRTALFANRSFEALTGFPVDRCPGVPCRHITRCGVCIQGCPALKLEATDQPVTVKTDMINFNRKRVSVKMVVSPLKDNAGKAAGFIETFYDISYMEESVATPESSYSFRGIVGRSSRMEKIFDILPVLAQSDASVLITGETGTGKDKVAEEIHNASPRAEEPFIKINCGALPETLLESELFGHTKGAFTGAVDSKPGRFRLAHNGTLYLTEIGDLPLTLQVKLLTVLDDGAVFPLGGNKRVPVNVRLIAATHRNLEEMVAEGRFRQDLFYRLNVARLHLPALRERNGDVRLLLDYFLHFYASKAGRQCKEFSDSALELLGTYAYPGNVRELSNIVEYAVAVCEGETIRGDHLPSYIKEVPAERGVRSDPAEKTEVPHAAKTFQPQAVDEVPSWKSVEKQMIMDALVKTGGHKGKAASILGWGRSTLWRKMKQYGIDR